jgi:hypothetical protein
MKAQSAIKSSLGLAACLASTLSGAPIAPQPSGSAYAFAFPSGGPRLEVDPGAGARISSLKFGTTEFLYVNRNILNWGSTFWPAPQSPWGWPPPHALDQGAYTGGPQGSALSLASGKDGATQLSFGKRFSADDADTSFTQTYIMRNQGTSARSVAPWQVTRVPSGGLTFFPKGTGAVWGDMASQVKEAEGWMWFELETATLPGGTPKAFADGSGGWMAHLDKNGFLLVEIFPDIAASQAAPQEAEIEIYAEPGKQYMELEHQGAYAPLAAGDSVAWTTRWYLRKAPAGVQKTPGNPALMAWVNSLVLRSTTARKENPGGSRTVRSALPPAGIFPVEGGRMVDAAGRARQGSVESP